MTRKLSVLFICLALLIVVDASAGGKEMLFHAGVGQRSSLNEIKQVFESRHPNVKVNFSYKGSGYFIADITRSNQGDLFMPGEEFYLLQAVERGFVTDYNPQTDIPRLFLLPLLLHQKEIRPM